MQLSADARPMSAWAQAQRCKAPGVGSSPGSRTRHVCRRSVPAHLSPSPAPHHLPSPPSPRTDNSYRCHVAASPSSQSSFFTGHGSPIYSPVPSRAGRPLPLASPRGPVQRSPRSPAPLNSPACRSVSRRAYPSGTPQASPRDGHGHSNRDTDSGVPGAYDCDDPRTARELFPAVDSDASSAASSAAKRIKLSDDPSTHGKPLGDVARMRRGLLPFFSSQDQGPSAWPASIREAASSQMPAGAGRERVEHPRGSPRGRPELALARRGLLGLGAAAVGAAVAESSGLNRAMAATASALAPPSTNPPPSAAVAAAEGEGKKGLLASVEKPKESRVYDASVLGEPVALSGKAKVWPKLLGARVVYLGEAERVHDPSDKVVELEVVKKLRDECFQQGRPVTVAFSAFPRPMQADLDAYFGAKLSEEQLRAKVQHWSPGRWEETLPILRYCKENGVRLFAAGVPPEVLRTVQSGGIRSLSSADRKKYAPPARGGTTHSPSSSEAATSPNYPREGSMLGQMLPSLGMTGAANAEGILPRTSTVLGPGPILFAQARVVEQHTIAQAVTQAMADGGAVGLLVVITGASHVRYGARGRGVPSKVVTKQKQKQLVVLLNPERQTSRAEGALPEADYLWYAGTRACTRNCFDRAEVARVMGAAGRRREGLPQDLQVGLERGLISPETLQSFLELESQPWIAEATKRFQGLRERFYADPKFLQRLCIEEAISITTTLIAQYKKRGERFWSEVEYVITDTVRGAVVDFFTVWLPAPTLSFDSKAMDPANALNNLTSRGNGNIFQVLTRWVAKLPDNAFQRPGAGVEWSLLDRAGAVVLGGAKLFAVGFVSSVGTVGFNNGLQSLRQKLARVEGQEHKEELKRSPVIKTAVVYAGFLGTSANLRYQVIAGAVEHWVADYFLASQPLAGAALSFVARTANSYYGTGQWVDLARRFGLQAHADEEPAGATPRSVPGPDNALQGHTEGAGPAQPPGQAQGQVPGQAHGWGNGESEAQGQGQDAFGIPGAHRAMGLVEVPVESRGDPFASMNPPVTGTHHNTVTGSYESTVTGAHDSALTGPLDSTGTGLTQGQQAHRGDGMPGAAEPRAEPSQDLADVCDRLEAALVLEARNAPACESLASEGATSGAPLVGRDALELMGLSEAQAKAQVQVHLEPAAAQEAHNAFQLEAREAEGRAVGAAGAEVGAPLAEQREVEESRRGHEALAREGGSGLESSYEVAVSDGHEASSDSEVLRDHGVLSIPEVLSELEAANGRGLLHEHEAVNGHDAANGPGGFAGHEGMQVETSEATNGYGALEEHGIDLEVVEIGSRAAEGEPVKPLVVVLDAEHAEHLDRDREARERERGEDAPGYASGGPVAELDRERGVVEIRERHAAGPAPGVPGEWGAAVPANDWGGGGASGAASQPALGVPSSVGAGEEVVAREGLTGQAVSGAHRGATALEAVHNAPADGAPMPNGSPQS